MDLEAGRKLEFVPRGRKPPFAVDRAEGRYQINLEAMEFPKGVFPIDLNDL